MRNHSNRSAYLSPKGSSAPRLKRSKKSSILAAVTSLFAAILILISVPFITPQAQESTATGASAFGIACTAPIGHGMNSKGSWEGKAFSSFIYPGLNNRQFTLEEAAGNFVGWTVFYGTADENLPDFTAKYSDTKENPDRATIAERYPSSMAKFDAERTLEKCVFSGALAQLANFNMSFASNVTSLAGWAATAAFNTDIICSAEQSANTSAACIDLLKIIGGRTASDNGGIIGTLTSGVYMPLILLAVLLTGAYAFYIGIVKRQLRQGFFAILWVFLAAIIGLALLLNPAMLVKAPMTAASTVTGCVVGAFSGESCFDGSGTGSESQIVAASDAVCTTNASNVTIDQRAAMAINGIRCQIWKAFVLQPQAQGAFGVGLHQLDTTSPRFAETMERAGIPTDQYPDGNGGGGICISLNSNGSINDFEGKRIEFTQSGQKICNLAIYDLYLKGAFKMEGQAPAPGADPEWFKVAHIAANEDGLWNQWTSNSTSGIYKMGSSIIAVVTSLLGGALIFVTSLMALVYYFSSIVLIAFAPIFLLFGVHPGRGKKLMFGWFEQVISGLLKYLISSIFLIVAITLLGSILAASRDMAMTLLTVAIMSAALFIYRKELINLLGRANMGGEQISGSLSDKISGGLSSVKNRGGRLGSAVAGGALGGLYSARGQDVGTKLDSMASGVKSGMNRSLKRGGGVVASTLQQRDRDTQDRKNDMKQRAKNAQDSIPNLSSGVKNAEASHQDAVNRRDDLMDYSNVAGSKLSELSGEAKEYKMAVEHAIKLTDLTGRPQDALDSNFTEHTRLQVELGALEINHALAELNGDHELAGSIASQMEATSVKMSAVRAKFLDENGEDADAVWSSNEERYAAALQRAGQSYDIVNSDGEVYTSRTHLDAIQNLANAEQAVIDNELLIDSTAQARERAFTEKATAEATATAYHATVEDWRPGDYITAKDDEKAQAKIEELKNENLSKLNEAASPIVKSQAYTPRSVEYVDTALDSDWTPQVLTDRPEGARDTPAGGGYVEGPLPKSGVGPRPASLPRVVEPEPRSVEGPVEPGAPRPRSAVLPTKPAEAAPARTQDRNPVEPEVVPNSAYGSLPTSPASGQARRDAEARAAKPVENNRASANDVEPPRPTPTPTPAPRAPEASSPRPTRLPTSPSSSPSSSSPATPVDSAPPISEPRIVPQRPTTRAPIADVFKNDGPAADTSEALPDIEEDWAPRRESPDKGDKS